MKQILAGVLAVVLAACAGIAPKKQAEYNGYGYVTSFKDVTEPKCKYGPYTWGGIGLSDGTVFPALSCTWKSLDGTLRSETVDMAELLKNKIVKWDFIDAQVWHERPFQMDPHVRVELRNKVLRISVQARVSTLGGPAPGGGQYLPVRIVTNTLLERTGQ